MRLDKVIQGSAERNGRASGFRGIKKATREPARFFEWRIRVLTNTDPFALLASNHCEGFAGLRDADAEGGNRLVPIVWDLAFELERVKIKLSEVFALFCSQMR
jgi:hypothetical protein